MNNLQLKRLTKAVHRWLSFQKLCGRDVLFSESYLSQPVAEFISHHHSGKIEPEYDHPQFISLTAGRPKQVDFALTTRHKHSVSHAIEAKWIRGVSYSKQAILNDLLRLECFRDDNRHVTRLFMVAGLQDNFEKNFLAPKYSDGSYKPFVTNFLSATMQSKSKIIDVIGTTGKLQNFYKEFHTEYKVDLPRRFRTELISMRTGDSICVYLWQIMSTKNRHGFSPQ